MEFNPVSNQSIVTDGEGMLADKHNQTVPTMTTRPDSEEMIDSENSHPASSSAQFPRSTAMQRSPQLSSTSLTRLLIAMCLLPIITIMTLWYIMPPVAEGQLQCQFTAKDLPDEDFYAIEYWKRDEYNLGELHVSNLGDQDWTHLNIQVNRAYQIYDREPIPAGTTKVFELNRFVSRAGARFSLRYNELKSARIYARRPKGDRATYYCEFKKGQAVEVER